MSLQIARSVKGDNCSALVVKNYGKNKMFMEGTYVQ